MDKIFGKGQRGGFMMPQNKIDQLIKYKNLLIKHKNLLSPYNLMSAPVFETWKKSNRYGSEKERKTQTKRRGKGLLTSMMGIPQDKKWNSVSLFGQIF